MGSFDIFDIHFVHHTILIPPVIIYTYEVRIH